MADLPGASLEKSKTVWWRMLFSKMDSKWIKLFCVGGGGVVQVHRRVYIGWIFFELEKFCSACKWMRGAWWRIRVWGGGWTHSERELKKRYVTGQEVGLTALLLGIFPNWAAQKRAALRLRGLNVGPSDVIWWAGNHFWNSVATHVQTIMSDYINPPQKLGWKMPLERVSFCINSFPLWTVFILFQGL